MDKLTADYIWMNRELVNWKIMKLNLMEQKELEIMKEVKGHGKWGDLTCI